MAINRVMRLTTERTWRLFFVQRQLRDGGRPQCQPACIRSPWGRLHAVDGNTGDILWSVPLGTTPQFADGKQDTGVINTFGGPTATAGGLVFNGTTSDGYFRAIDSESGEMLSSELLPYSGQTIPITHEGNDGWQYVAIVVASAASAGPPLRNEEGRPLNGESIFAFAPRVLPHQTTQDLP